MGWQWRASNASPGGALRVRAWRASAIAAPFARCADAPADGGFTSQGVGTPSPRRQFKIQGTNMDQSLAPSAPEKIGAALLNRPTGPLDARAQFLSQLRQLSAGQAAKWGSITTRLPAGVLTAGPQADQWRWLTLPSLAADRISGAEPDAADVGAPGSVRGSRCPSPARVVPITSWKDGTALAVADIHRPDSGRP